MKKGHVIYCNRCGRRLEGTDLLPGEEGLHIEKSWGYFLEKTEKSTALTSVSPVTTCWCRSLRSLRRKRSRQPCSDRK